MQFHRPCEVQKSFHHAIQPQNLARDNLHLRRDIGVLPRQFHARQLHVHQDRVQRILHLVRHPAGDLADGGEPIRRLQLPPHLPRRLRIAQPHQQPRPASRIVPRVERLQNIHREQCHECARSVPPRNRHAPVADRPAGLRRLRQHQPQRGVGRKDFRQRQPHQIGAHLAQEFLHRSRRYHQPAVAPEHQHRVFQLIQQPLEVPAQIGKIELRPAQLLPQQADFASHHAELVRARARHRGDRGRIVFPRRHQVEQVPQPSQRPERDDRKQQRDTERARHRC